MKRRRNAQSEIGPDYIRPVFDARQRDAKRDRCRAVEVLTEAPNGTVQRTLFSGREGVEEGGLRQ